MNNLNDVVTELLKDEKVSEYLDLIDELVAVYINQPNIDKKEIVQVVNRTNTLKFRLVQIEEATVG